MSHQKCKLRLFLLQSMHKTGIKWHEVLNKELVLFKSGISHGQYAQHPGNKLVSGSAESSQDTGCKTCVDTPPFFSGCVANHLDAANVYEERKILDLFGFIFIFLLFIFILSNVLMFWLF